jgi:hypothetical protein
MTRQFRWPVRPRRKPDELLSSWLTRASRRNGIKPYVFCSAVWPKKHIWNRDPDWVGDPEILAELCRQTGADPEEARSATLGELEGKLFRDHRLIAKTAWLIPIGVHHRIREGYGLGFCPLCLLEDDEPYFRRSWRLGFVTACARHLTVLHDRCPNCAAPLNPHRVPLDAPSLRSCFACGEDLARTPLQPAFPRALAFQLHLEEVAANGWVTLPTCRGLAGPLYFAMVHQIVRLMATGRAAPALRRQVAKVLDCNIPEPTFVGPGREIEMLTPMDRHRLLLAAAAVMSDWPNVFVEICRNERIWSSSVLRDFVRAPFLFQAPVMRHLYRPSYVPNEAEVRAAAAWFWRVRGKVPTREIKRFISTDSHIQKETGPPPRRR